MSKKNAWAGFGKGFSSFKFDEPNPFAEAKKPFADFFKGTQGGRLISKNAWNVSPSAERSVQEQETFIENPTTNRWIGKDGKEYLEPSRGRKRIQKESTAIEDIIYDPDKQVASVMFVGGEHYYDYKVTPEEMEDFLKASSKGRHVSTLWNDNPHFHI